MLSIMTEIVMCIVSRGTSQPYLCYLNYSNGTLSTLPAYVHYPDMGDGHNMTWIHRYERILNNPGYE